MSPSTSDVLAFFAAQREKQQRYFGAKEPDKFLAHMGSTSAPGVLLAVSAHRVKGLGRGDAPNELVVELEGALPRGPRGAVLAPVCLFSQYVGYQVKTRAAGAAPVASGPEGTRVRGGQVFTLHHSPFMMTAFEKVPVEEVLANVGGARFALVGLGVDANLSPRFCFHHEERAGKIVMFHGDGLPLKTYLNLKSNPSMTRVVIDPETFEGYLATGTVAEFRAEEAPEAHERICRGFAAGGWGKPARTFRFVAERWTPLAPL
jgi:hypothetical protein